MYSNEDGHGFLRHYSVMLYYGILNIGQNDYMPKNPIEYIYCISTLLFSAILNTLIFGDIANLAASV